MLNLLEIGINKLSPKSTKEKEKKKKNINLPEKKFHWKHWSTEKDGRFPF